MIPMFPPQELVRLRGAQERELRRAGRRGELPGAHRGPLPGLPARLPATSDVSIPWGNGEGEVQGVLGLRQVEMLDRLEFFS